MDKDVKSALDDYEAFESHWSDTRQDMLDDLKFCRLGEQWDEGIKEDRARNGRPTLTINKLPAFARQVINDARLNKPAIKTHPADDKADTEVSELLNGIIRNIEYNSDAETAYDTALECAVYAGMGFYRIAIDYASSGSFDKDIRIERIANPLSVLPDPSTMACDGSDWNKAFITQIMSRDTFKANYPKADPVDFKGSEDVSSQWRTEDDVMVAELWERSQKDAELVRLSDNTVMLSEQYEKNFDLFNQIGLSVIATRPTKIHQVTQKILTAEEVIDTVEWPGEHIPIIPVYGDEFVVEGKRFFYSMFKHAKDSQRMFNYWRTSSVEMVALQPKTPFIGAKGSFTSDAKNWATANTENHPYLEYDVVDGGGTPARQSPPTIPAGALQETSSADNDMKSIIGIQDAALGAMSNEISGVAINSRKYESDISNFHFIDNFSRSMKYAGRVLIEIIPKVYSEPRIARIMGYDGTTESVPLMQEYEKGGVVKMHDLSAGKYDVTVEVGGSFTTKRAEALESMKSMVSSAPQLMQIIGDLIAKNMDWEGADEIAKRLKAMLPPQLQQLDSMEDIPEEARAAVMQIQQQMQSVQTAAQQAAEQKDMQIAELSRVANAMQQQLQNKQGEIQVKQDKLGIDYEIAQMKEMGDVRLAEIEAKYDKELEILKSQLKEMQNIRMPEVVNDFIGQ